MIRAQKKTDPDIVYKGVRKVLPKLTPQQLDSVQHEIRSMLMELDNAEENDTNS